MINRMYVNVSIVLFVLSMFGSPVTSVHADSELSSVKAFNEKIAQLQVGSDIEILALGEGRIDITGILIYFATATFFIELLK